MSSRRNFIKQTALLAGATAIPSVNVFASETSENKSTPLTPIKLPYKNTYIKNIFVTENEFRNAKQKIIESPGFEKAKEMLPVPFWKGNNDAINMYWKTWEIAFKNIKNPAEESGFITTYIDTAYNGNIFMWDSNFITLFTRYGSRAYPFQNTLDNFYAKQHPDGFICREIWGATGEDCFHRYDPTSTGPNLLPWSEMENFKQFGDLERIHKIFPVLCAYYQWLRLNRTWQDGSYWSSGWGTGMDNMPRVSKEYNPIYSNGHMSWLDTCLQQLFIGKLLVDFGFYTERWQEIEDIESETKSLKKLIKEKMWDSKSNFFYDRYSDGRLGSLKNVGAYWALWTDLLSKDELEGFINNLFDKDTFYRKHPIPSIPANNEKYQPEGRYWEGGVWAPTNYMIIKGLLNNGFYKQSFDLAMKHHQQVKEVFKKTNTFWEYYAPETTDPGLLARPDFVGWTGLVPVSILFECIFGINSNYLKKTIDWHVNLIEEHGITSYPIGSHDLLSFKCADRSSSKQRPSIVIDSTMELTLNLSWEGGKETIMIKQGNNKI